jgi:hypothetical protein
MAGLEASADGESADANCWEAESQASSAGLPALERSEAQSADVPTEIDISDICAWDVPTESDEESPVQVPSASETVTVPSASETVQAPSALGRSPKRQRANSDESSCAASSDGGVRLGGPLGQPSGPEPTRPELFEGIEWWSVILWNAFLDERWSRGAQSRSFQHIDPVAGSYIVGFGMQAFLDRAHSYAMDFCNRSTNKH